MGGFYDDQHKNPGIYCQFFYYENKSNRKTNDRKLGKPGLHNQDEDKASVLVISPSVHLELQG